MTCSSRYGDRRGHRTVATSTPHLGTDRAPQPVWRKPMRSTAGPLPPPPCGCPCRDSPNPRVRAVVDVPREHMVGTGNLEPTTPCPPDVGRGSAEVRQRPSSQVNWHAERRRTEADHLERGAMVVKK